MRTRRLDAPASELKRERISARMARLTMLLTALVALTAALAFPGGYFILGHRYARGSLEAQADLIAQVLSGLIDSNPTQWQYETLRIEELLANRLRTGPGDSRRIFDTGGQLVAESTHRVAGPTMTIYRDMLYAGAPVGRIEISHSLRGLVRRSGILALLGALLGLLVFRLLPFRAAIAFARKLEQANGLLERDRTFTQALLDNLVEGVVACDARGEQMIFNRTFRQWHGQDFLDQPMARWAGRAVLYERNGTTPLPAGSVPLMRALNREVLRNVPLAIRIPGQPLRQVSCNGAPILDGRGQVLGAVVVLHDVSQLERLNEELEERVRERTMLLERANRELDAFSYSVSHDLRAPLRGIDGFSHALLTECGEELSPEARHYLQRVRSGIQRMGSLIDDLLRMSRVSRIALNDQPLDLSAMALAILAEFRQDHPGGALEIEVEPGLTALGDPGLIRVVMDNLLGNALKYTARVPAPRIAFLRATRPDGGRAFCVRDNGVGFDMAYADKLFGAFQRLHAAPEFEGSGIGLAIVKRIIHRHGGEVWAQAAVGQGASFYFTLPEATLNA